MAKEYQDIVSPGRVVTFDDLGVAPRVKGDVGTSFAQAVRVLRQNWRQGTVAVKDRSQVSRTNRKPFKQKGTGRARAGTARSPLWRGGGVTFGPNARVKSLRTTKGQRRAVQHGLLTEFMQKNAVISLDWQVAGDVPRTKPAYEILKKIGLVDRKVNLFVSPNDQLAFASFANLQNVRVLFFDQPNAADLALADCWIFFEKDRQLFSEMVLRWI